MTNTMEKITRLGKFLICLAVAAFVVWRGNSYIDQRSPSAIPSVMCAVFAITITLTGFALANDKSA